MKKEITWEASIHLYRDNTILKQLLIAIGLPFGLVILFLFWVAIKSKSVMGYYGLVMIAILFIVTFFFIALVYQNKIHVRYELNQKNITMMMSQQQAKKNNMINLATMIVGLLKLSPTPVGAGLLVSSHQQQTMKLIDIDSIKIDDHNHKIIIKDSFYEFIVQCTTQNYQDVKNFIQQHSLF